MIGRLRGKVQFISEDQLLVDVQGVGYLVSVPTSTAMHLVEGSEAMLLIHTQVREDAITLFGFATPSEKQIFELLNTVSGVGPKLALSVLSVLSPDNFCDAILRANLKRLTEVPGIGKRTGERLIVELKDKIAKSYSPISLESRLSSIDDQVAGEALEALLALGYSTVEADEALSHLALDGTENTETVVRKALGFLVKAGNVLR